MPERILFVDDDPNILAACKRQLRNDFNVDTALGGSNGVEALENDGPFAVVIADMQMPGMNGIEFLAEVRKRAPNTTRVMLTGDADQRTPVAAVNEGQIFRFLNKPCPPDVLKATVDSAVRQYQLVIAEKQLLEQTLSGSVQALTEILSIVDPMSFQLSQKIRDYVNEMSDASVITGSWELTVAAMLSQVGLVTIPQNVVAKARAGKAVTVEERRMLERVPEVGRNLLMKIPRLEAVATIVYYQSKRFDGLGFPRDAVTGEQIPIESRILKVLGDLGALELRGASKPQAFDELRSRKGWYDLQVLDSAASFFVREQNASPIEHSHLFLSVRQLRAGHTLASNIETTDGKLLIAAGHKISDTVLARIVNFSTLMNIKEPIAVHEDAADDVECGASVSVKGAT